MLLEVNLTVHPCLLVSDGKLQFIAREALSAPLAERERERRRREREREGERREREREERGREGERDLSVPFYISKIGLFTSCSGPSF